MKTKHNFNSKYNFIWKSFFYNKISSSSYKANRFKFNIYRRRVALFQSTDASDHLLIKKKQI